MNPAPQRLLDAAKVATRTRPEDYVWHFVLHRAGALPARGERLATLALAPADIAGVGRADQLRAGLVSSSPADQLAHGLAVLERAIAAERREWVRRTMRAGYVDGWGVAVVAERGYRRTVFPGVGLAAMAGARLAVPVARGALP